MTAPDLNKFEADFLKFKQDCENYLQDSKQDIATEVRIKSDIKDIEGSLNNLKRAFVRLKRINGNEAKR